MLATKFKHFLRLGLGFVAASTLGLASFPAVPATADSTIGVTSTVQATCLNTATPLAFGTYTGVLAPGTATVTITCTNTTPYNVGLSAGLGTAATVTTRALTGTVGGAQLHYVLTSDAAYSVNWGLTVASDTVAGTGNGAAQTLTVYGQVAAGQYIAPGAYTDTITATVTY